MRDSVSTTYYRNNRIACVRFNFCERNTLTLARVRSLADGLGRVANEQTVRCVIFASSTPNFFSDGFSLREMFGEQTRAELINGQSPRYDEVVALYRRLIETPIPTFAFIDGVCRGAGLEWALGCDFIVATSHATFAFHETRLGIVPGLGGIGLLQMRVNRPRALYQLFSSEGLTGEEAVAVGLVDKVVTTLETAVDNFAFPIARHPRSALCRTKSLTGIQDLKVRALLDSRKPFLDTLKSRLFRETGAKKEGE